MEVRHPHDPAETRHPREPADGKAEGDHGVIRYMHTSERHLARRAHER